MIRTKRRSFDDFVGANAASLLRTARLITLDDNEAEDLVQECLIVVSKRWGRISLMDNPAAYARRVLVNLIIRRAEKQSRTIATSTELPETATSPDHSEATADRDELFRALQQLHARQRSVLALRYFLDLSAEQTAEALGCQASTVRSTTSRALEQLRALLSPEPSSMGVNHDH